MSQNSKVDALAVMYRLAGNCGLSAGDCEDLLAAREAVIALRLAAANALGDLTTCGEPRPIKGKERTHALLVAALAQVGAP